jgi:tRNA uridine 5-carbamoylmethylation protein Kti12
MNKLYIIIGAYGSGKTEYSVNLALNLRKKFQNVSLCDLDVVNPYFRSRDVKEAFEKKGIVVIAPEGQFSHADLPMLSPKVKGYIENTDFVTILDVGGDPAGCRTISRYHKEIEKRGYEMLMVVNTKRPFTQNQNEIEEMIEQLEFSSKLKITEIISNTNLMEFTELEIVENGIKICNNVAKNKNIKFDKFLVVDRYTGKIPDNILNKKRIILEPFMNKPWEGGEPVLLIGI